MLRNADAIVYCQPASSPPGELAAVQREVSASGIDLPALLVATKVDEAADGDVTRLSREFGPDVVAVSVLDDASLDRLREAIWRLTGLIRVYLRHGRETDEEPLALHPDATVEEVAHEIHHDLAESFQAARIWGPSARFEGQRVGRGHVVVDGDVVEIVR